MLERVRAFLPSALAVASLAIVVDSAGADTPFLNGPHPFLKDNELSVSAGYGVANYFSGMRAGVAYGFQAAGSLWLDLRLDILDGRIGTQEVQSRCACAQIETFVDVLAGIKYKLRMNVPVIPYAGLVAGPVYLFPDYARSAFGLAARGSLGARYFLYDWLGFGLELGALVGGAWVENVAGLQPGLRVLDLALGAEIQF
jgi:hypothetical protein